jgi:hypothetical protein
VAVCKPQVLQQFSTNSQTTWKACLVDITKHEKAMIKCSSVVQVKIADFGLSIHQGYEVANTR